MRTPGELCFSLGALVRLVPAPLRGSQMPQAHLLAICSQLRRRQLLEGGALRCRSAAGTVALTRQLTASLAQGGVAAGGEGEPCDEQYPANTPRMAGS